MARDSKKNSSPKAAPGSGRGGGKRSGKSKSDADNKEAEAVRSPVKTRKRPKSKSAKASAKHKDLAPLKTSWMKRWRRKLIKWALILLFLACLLPLLVTLLYSVPAVKPVSTLMISKWMQGEKVDRRWVSIDQISPFVMQSVISSEDGKFCFHNGVDWDAVNLVVDDLIEGERSRGASTIPMQAVKNLYLWSSRSYVRKGLEVPLALMVDSIWSKKRLMEIYLNIAEWGPGIYGIEAAARHHFKRSAKRLTRRQAALLAVTLPNPIVRNPRKPRRGLRRLARLVERRARQSGAYVKCVR